MFSKCFWGIGKRVKKNGQNDKIQYIEFRIISVGGCGGQPLHSKSISKSVSQMAGFCDDATALKSYLRIGFLTFLALLKN